MSKRICVFCGSSSGAREGYRTAAISLAKYLVARRIPIVYGGGNVGLMGTLADAAVEEGGEVIGVIPQSLLDKELAHKGLAKLHVVASMHERKAMMADLSDAFIAMPGGFGTFEEFCEVLTWTQLGLHRKPCGLLNIDGYYDHLLALFDHASSEGFLKPEHRRMVLAERNHEVLVESLLDYRMPLVDKWIDRKQT